MDESHDARLPAACPDGGGAVAPNHVATPYQDDVPVVRPIVRAFHGHVGACRACGRRVQGRPPLQSSDALGAAATHLGPQALTLVVWWHTGLGLPFGTVQRIRRTQYGLSITRGALAQVCARVATRAAPTYAAWCAEVRGSPVVAPDETGWTVGRVLHWLWAAATPTTTVYRIAAGHVSPHGLAVARGRLLQQMLDGLTTTRSTVPDVQRVAAHLTTEATALLTFLGDPAIDATNWRAEHAIRPAVVTRKVCGGNRTRRGADTQQVLASVLRTLDQRGLDPTDVFTPLLQARRAIVAPALQTPLA